VSHLLFLCNKTQVLVVKYLLQQGADTQIYNDNNKLAGEEFDILFEVRVYA
jgi:hypothetical protein